jgi:RNA polymerase sigma-70 factor (ECF subfamily)
MSVQPLDDLLDQFRQGDSAAAERLYSEFEPYLRKVVRRQLPRQLRSKFDSTDVVQSAWAIFLHRVRDASWRFAGPDQLRAFLTTVTRNRLTDRIRHFHAALGRERSLDQKECAELPASTEPRPSELARASDLWKRMLALCPPEHHELLHLKRQGWRLQDIAARTGLHEGSVRRILRQLARRLAFESAN